jgi:uncharacterized lipoprotein YddW (UPF0748 family)
MAFDRDEEVRPARTKRAEKVVTLVAGDRIRIAKNDTVWIDEVVPEGKVWRLRMVVRVVETDAE